jgi:hypothetical protein
MNNARTLSGPYLFPEGRVQIAFSGGRTSAYMLHHLLEANGSFDPARVQVVFGNTGREMPQTLDFVRECGKRWGVPIVWVEYRPALPLFEVVDFASASRCGEPFSDLIVRKRALPSQARRWCTSELKVLAAHRYLRSIGWREYSKAVGIRADEAHRMTGDDKDANVTRWRPLVEAGVTKTQVLAFWDRQCFDLRLPRHSSLGNCDGCFLKSEVALAALARDYPERHAWWQSQEAATGWTWTDRYTRAALADRVQRQGDWLFSTDGVLCQANDGECTDDAA